MDMGKCTLCILYIKQNPTTYKETTISQRNSTLIAAFLFESSTTNQSNESIPNNIISWSHIESLLDNCANTELDLIFLGDINLYLLNCSDNVCFKLAYWFQRRRFLNIFPIGSYVKTMSADGGHLGWRFGSLDIVLKVDHLRTIHAMFALNWLTGFREKKI